MAEVSAAILTDKKEEAKRLIKKFNRADYIQFDVIDGKFVHGKTLWAEDIASLKVKQPKELHLMIKQPEKYLSDFLKCRPSRLIFHIESTKKPIAIIKKLKNKNIQAGIAINPETKIRKIIPYLDKIDFILVMTVHPGKQNQKFLISQLAKIKQLRKLSSVNIGVDGGINIKTARLAVKAGATTICSGSYLAKHPEAINHIKKL